MKCTATLTYKELRLLIAKSFGFPKDLVIVTKNAKNGEPTDIEIECSWESPIDKSYDGLYYI